MRKTQVHSVLLVFSFLFLQLSLPIDVLAQKSAGIDWESCYGGTWPDWPTNIIQAHGGGYVMAGASTSMDGIVSDSHGGYDGWLPWVENNGFFKWAKSYGGKSADAFACIKWADTGYIVAGSTASIDGDIKYNHGNEDAWILKLSPSGNIVWQKTYGGKRYDQANSIAVTNDGGYIFCGETNSTDGDVSGAHDTLREDIWVVKLNDTGKIEWQKCLGGSDRDAGYDIIQTADSNYVIAGQTQSKDGDITSNKGVEDAWIIKLDRNGNILWQKTIGGSRSDYCKSIQQTSDGGYIVGATTSSNDGDVSFLHGTYNNDYWVLKLDDTGKIEWQKSYGGSQNETLSAIIQTTDGGYLMTGNSESTDGDVKKYHKSVLGYGGDELLLRIDDTGRIMWQKCLGGSYAEKGTGLLQVGDSTYVTVGSAESNDGDVTGLHGGIAVPDYWPVQIHESVIADTDTTAGLAIINESSIQVYPSRTNGIVHVQLAENNSVADIRLMDMNGHAIDATVHKNGTERTLTIPNGTAAGMLLVQIRTGDGMASRKIVYRP